MNGLGRLIKGDLDIVGQFSADHFVREVEDYELGGLEGFILSDNIQ